MTTAVLERERRSTAGKRLTFLTGQSAIEDDAFWGHETWHDNEEEEEDNESFHSSDEDSELLKDEFDSDFDISESDSENMEIKDGINAQEKQLLLEERKEKHSKQQKRKIGAESSNKSSNVRRGGTAATTTTTTYMEVSSAGRTMLVQQKPLAKRSRFTKGKRVMGEGWNAGIVLHLPSSATTTTTITTTTNDTVTTGPVPDVATTTIKSTPMIPVTMIQTHLQHDTIQSTDSVAAAAAAAATTIATSGTNQLQQSVRNKSYSRPTLATTRKRRNKIGQDDTNTTTTTATSNDQQPPLPDDHLPTIPLKSQSTLQHENVTISNELIRKTKKTKSKSIVNTKTKATSTHTSTPSTTIKNTYLQEELLVEAVTMTEPENLRWLLGRQRNNRIEKDRYEKIQSNEQYRSGGYSCTIVERFVSRRGYLNTIAFPDMDHIPSLFDTNSRNQVTSNHTMSSISPPQHKNTTVLCAITGKTAHYRDPKTLMYYHDKQAFHELRRRYDAGELIDGNTSYSKTSSVLVSSNSRNDGTTINNNNKKKYYNGVVIAAAAAATAADGATVTVPTVEKGMSNVCEVSRMTAVSTDGSIVCDEAVTKPISSKDTETATTLSNNSSKSHHNDCIRIEGIPTRNDITVSHQPNEKDEAVRTTTNSMKVPITVPQRTVDTAKTAASSVLLPIPTSTRLATTPSPGRRRSSPRKHTPSAAK